MDKNKWMSKNSKPSCSMWFYTRNEDGSIASRYYDDSDDSWWTSNARDGWTPNNSFVEWLLVPEAMKSKVNVVT